MNDFTASNGVIVREHPGAIGIRRSVEDLAPVPVPGFTRPERVQTYLDPRQWDAVTEAVQAEADERLGRWRWPEDDDFVVYPARVGLKGPDAFVLNEAWGASLEYYHGGDYPNSETGPFANAASAYFGAHPEPKPWHDAKAGEVWAFTYSYGADDQIKTDAFSVDSFGYFRTTSGVRINLSDLTIAVAHRIFPEVS